MTTTHMNYMMSPVFMLFDKAIDRLFPWLDRYDFDSAKLTSKIGFWGSRFAIGIYLGVFVGLLARRTPQEVFTLAFTAAACLELFSIIGTWFIASVEPLSQGIADFANNSAWLKGRSLNIGLDWPFIAGRSEVWACANVLAPVLLFEALLLSTIPAPWMPEEVGAVLNGVLPLSSIIVTGLSPALLVVTRGRIIRMCVIGAVVQPLFLVAATLVSGFVTTTAAAVGAQGGFEGLITMATMEGPIEKFLAFFIGRAWSGSGIYVAIAAVAVVLYVAAFLWYRKQMLKRNAEYAEQRRA